MGKIEDVAKELTILMVGSEDEARIASEIADATTRVNRRYFDDDNTEAVVVGKETIVTGTKEVFIKDEEGVDTKDVETVDVSEEVDKTEDRLKAPSDEDILARLELKLASIKRSMDSNE